ncbi:hypothetical protein H0H87_007464 [Tephrocybe sp. NHM501043]|nr:hypothetical protein H0H87_007464 [Tephrocybe sp. NHM501043]
MPGLDRAIVEGIKDCRQCKNFGSAHINALLDPITRCHPFELIVGDYLSLPKGAGGYKTAGLYLDMYFQHLWGFKSKSAGSTKTTEDALHKISTTFVPCEAFMSNGGSHFNNTMVHDFCVSQGTKAHIISMYSPWVNSLVESTNKLLLHVLKKLCTLDLNKDEYNAINWESLPTNWLNHFDHAITILNWQLLPALKFMLKELLLGLVVNTRPTPVELSTQPIISDDTLTKMAYIKQQWLDGYSEVVAHAVKWKLAFDRKVLGKGLGEVVFLPGDLVQVYQSDLDYTFKSECKILPKWS